MKLCSKGKQLMGVVSQHIISVLNIFFMEFTSEPLLDMKHHSFTV